MSFPVLNHVTAALLLMLLGACSGGSDNAKAGCLAGEKLSALADSDVYLTKADCEAAHDASNACDAITNPKYADYNTRCQRTHQLGKVCAATYVADAKATEPAAKCYPIPDEDNLDSGAGDTDQEADWKFKCTIEGNGKCAVP